MLLVINNKTVFYCVLTANNDRLQLYALIINNALKDLLVDIQIFRVKSHVIM